MDGSECRRRERVGPGVAVVSSHIRSCQQADGRSTGNARAAVTSSRKGTPEIADTIRRVWSEFKMSIAELKQAGRDGLSLLANLISMGLL